MWMIRDSMHPCAFSLMHLLCILVRIPRRNHRGVCKAERMKRRRADMWVPLGRTDAAAPRCLSCSATRPPAPELTKARSD